MHTRTIRWVFWPTAVVLVLGTTFFVWKYSQTRRSNNNANAAAKNGQDVSPDTDPEEGQEQPVEPISVNVANPRRGAMERVTVQVGTVQADEVNLHAQVSGILKPLKVDIGDRVEYKDVLAEIEVPELEKQVERNRAVVEQAEARVKQMEAKVAIAQADLEATKAQIAYAEANARAASAMVRYRKLKYDRMDYLASKTSVEGALVDEAVEHLDAARENENSAKAAIIVSHAKVKSSEAKKLLTDADVKEAETQVKIAKADLGKSLVLIDFAKIRAEFSGIITQRPLYKGAFVRSASEGGAAQTVLTLQRTDLMRVVVQIPAADAPFADPGDPAEVEIDVLEQKFPAKVSRVAKSADPRTRLMPVEIDLPNPDGRIRQGMFGKVTIILDKAIKQISIPSDCLVGKTGDGQGMVYVVRADKKARRTSIKVGTNNGKRVEVLHGLKTTDEVIVRPPSALTEDADVVTTPLDESRLKDHSQP
jgi:HlyD family secretion protein